MAIRGILRDAFPAIQEIIIAESRRLGRSVDREDIGPKLKDHPRTRGILRDEWTEEKGNVDEYVRNIVDWYSQKWTANEKNTLDPRQKPWVLPTFKGIRRHKGRWPNYDWLYEPENRS